MPKSPEGGYQPTPKEIKKAENMMTDEQKAFSQIREVSYKAGQESTAELPEGEKQATQESTAEAIEHLSPEQVMTIFEKLNRSHAWLKNQNTTNKESVEEVESHFNRELPPPGGEREYDQLRAFRASAAALYALDSMKSMLYESVSDETRDALIQNKKLSGSGASRKTHGKRGIQELANSKW